MAIARLQFSVYQSSNENGGGDQPWSNVQGAGSTNEAGGAYSVRDPNSANMNWLRSNGDGSRGSATIPAGATIKGIVVGVKIHQYGGAQIGGNYVVQLFQFSSPVGTAKTGNITQGSTVGPFGSPTDLWGLTGLTPTSFSNVYFGHHCNFPSISANINIYSWDLYMDIYYDEAVSQPAAISAVGGNNQSANTSAQYPTALTAYVTDQGGNPRPLTSVTFTLPASGASGLFQNATRFFTTNTNSLGIATSQLITANATAGAWQPVADVTGSSPLIFTLFTLTNTTPPPVLVPTTMTVVQGSGQSAPVSTAFSLLQKVQVKDQFGANFPNATVIWATPNTGRGTYPGLVASTTTTTDSSGIATAPVLTAGTTSGAWTGTATAQGFSGVNQNFSFTNIPNAAPPTPTTLVVTQGSNQAAALNAAFAATIQVQVLDQYGSPYGGANVGGSIPSSNNGKFSNNTQSITVVSSGSGTAVLGVVTAGPVAIANWSITISSTGTSPVTVTGLYNIDPITPTSITAVSGQGQSAATSATFALPLRARVMNGLSQGLQNVSVTFTAPPSGASCSFVAGALNQTVLTDVNGYAQTTVAPTANGTIGGYNVVASISGFSVNFNLTNGDGFLAEVCTSQEALPTGATAPASGGSGTPVSWTNPQNASATAQGASFAFCPQPYNAGSQSNYLILKPAPASWAANIQDGAVINSFQVVYSTFYDNGGGPAISAGVLQFSTALNGVQATGYTAQNGSSPGDNIWGNPIPRSSGWSSGAKITGAQLKANNNTGVGIRWSPPSNAAATSGVRINGVTLRVCYQNPDGSVATTAFVPLLYNPS